jgi:hypothetical protein
VKDEDLPKLFPKGVDKVSMPSGITYVMRWVVHLCALITLPCGKAVPIYSHYEVWWASVPVCLALNSPT